MGMDNQYENISDKVNNWWSNCTEFVVHYRDFQSSFIAIFSFSCDTSSHSPVHLNRVVIFPDFYFYKTGYQIVQCQIPYTIFNRSGRKCYMYALKASD